MSHKFFKIEVVETIFSMNISQNKINMQFTLNLF